MTVKEWPTEFRRLANRLYFGPIDLDDAGREPPHNLLALAPRDVPPAPSGFDDPAVRMLLGRLNNYLPYGSDIWQDVMRARGLDPRPRSMT